ncbi:thymidylate synthase [Haloarcula californiae tailed virus 1]|uniref:Thymidylate synthase n=1 Tax=Haloarcula californiae tailed virus 1 TaxID=1273746 RepID=R4THX6_9CAUD|nr:thymidylate synthase [Haloarcula californiae tailed virus 1]AGM11901.1 thymidylate synthase [Haloarcula californiae tailed virus 1]
MQVKLLEATDEAEEVICRAARNDYMSEYGAEMPFSEVMSSIDGDSIEEKKGTLIGNLMDHGHYGPFEHVQATFHVEGISRSCMAQITRHRHASFDIQSMRYVPFDEADPTPGEAVVTIPELEDPTIAGRNAEFAEVFEDLDPEEILEKRRDVYEQAMKESFMAYNELLDLGAAPENARMVLPIGTKVNMVVSLNARMLMHVADMRAAADAQWEIRKMTEGILDLAEDWCPYTFEYYNENLKNRKNRLAP